SHLALLSLGGFSPVVTAERDGIAHVPERWRPSTGRFAETWWQAEPAFREPAHGSSLGPDVCSGRHRNRRLSCNRSLTGRPHVTRQKNSEQGVWGRVGNMTGAQDE